MTVINFETTRDDWFGYRRHIFSFEEREAWIVEPAQAAPGMPWTWCIEWPEAFVKRTGVPDLLGAGFHHVHLQARGFGNESDQAAFRRFQDFLGALGLAPKAALVGMSLGGLYSMRYAAMNPDRVACIYLDAPVCSFEKFEYFDSVKEAYGLTSAENVEHDPRLPVNLAEPLLSVPLLLIYGADDLTVKPALNCELFAERYRGFGGKILIEKRLVWGHHPHGLDSPSMIVDFIKRNSEL